MVKEDLIYEILELKEGDKLLNSHMRVYLKNLDKILSLLPDERDICLLKKRYYNGKTLKKSGRSIVKVSFYKDTPCEGVSGSRAAQIIFKAIRKLRHPSRLRVMKTYISQANQH